MLLKLLCNNKTHVPFAIVAIFIAIISKKFKCNIGPIVQVDEKRYYFRNL